MTPVAAFGVGFQFPSCSCLPVRGVLTPQQLLGAWRYAIVGIVVIAAVITPSGDPILGASPWACRCWCSTSLPSASAYLVQRRSAGRTRCPRVEPVTDARAVIASAYPFELDRFQSRGARRPRRRAVVWSPRRSAAARRSSPSTASKRAGSGKRAFYTAPIKALSNQKFRDLTDRYGAGTSGC